MLNWTPWALPGLAVFFGGMALAMFIYRARPDREQNRLLALQLVCEAIRYKLHRRRLFPGVEASEAYLAQRKHEVYRSAVEAALQNGDVSERERAILEGLQASLEVSAAEALRIEREVAIALRTRPEAVVAVV